MNHKRRIFVFFLLAAALVIFSGCKKQQLVWYVQPEFERAWTRFFRNAKPPVSFKEVREWDGGEVPEEPGFLITTAPFEKKEKVSIYYLLPYEQEYQGAYVLALDPWMVFHKHTNPELRADRVYSERGGSGLLLITGRDSDNVDAWTARFVQQTPGVFPDEEAWQEMEKNLFRGNRFPQGAQSYNWQDVFFRLMGNEPAWVYAPLSAIRRYQNPRKAILEATAFPERGENNQYSLQANLLWAVPVGSEKEKRKLAPVIKWLKNPATQTAIANILDWIPADPYGIPYDPVSMSAHRNWLTAAYVYALNNKE